MEWIANQIGDSAENLLTQFEGKHHRIADHFWCNILAALATILSKILETSNQLLDDTAEGIAKKAWELVEDIRSEERVMFLVRQKRQGTIPAVLAGTIRKVF